MSDPDDLNNVRTRFEKQLAGDILPVYKQGTQTSTKSSTTRTKKAVVKAQKPKKDVHIAGKPKPDPMFDLEMEFSDNGETYGNPLVNPPGGAEIFVRLRLRQHNVEPLLQGFQLIWTKPPTWAWVDGLGSSTFDEAISNALVVTRIARAPSHPASTGFRVRVAHKYAP